jgi:GT2 family glycosyltransferase
LIIVYHKNNQISRVISEDKDEFIFDGKATIAGGLYHLAVRFPQSKIVWCDESYQAYLNLKEIETVFHHNKMMLSYRPGEMDFLGRKIGYVEESPFIKINKKVSYPTWQMSSIVGVIYASLLIEIKGKIKMDADFDYYLNSVAKVCMPLGLLCYSEPKLLSDYKDKIIAEQASIYTLFKFVKQHYKLQWMLLLLLNFMVYERKIPLLPFISTLFFKSRKKKELNLDAILVQSSLTAVDKKTIDVIIPTIGRKHYLHDVLQDLAQQTHLPVHVIIIEQNPRPGSISELDFLHNETWPFSIKHTFTHEAGAFNARNLALSQVESEWVFLADDDIRFDVEFFKNVFCKIEQYGAEVITTSCLQQNEIQRYIITNQSGIFGSGNSFLKAKLLKKVSFNERFEFGYGEDADFGLQLRNSGADIIYFPEIKILHLKAHMGGFRTKLVLKWENELIQPKPSPTVMLYKVLHNTREQILGYKLVLFFKLFKKSAIKNPVRFVEVFKKQWESSVYWTNQLNKKL